VLCLLPQSLSTVSVDAGVPMADKRIVFPSGVTVTLFPAPPEAFHPLRIDEDARLRYGLPRRPADSESAARWERMLGQTVRLIEPVFRRKAHRIHGPLLRKDDESNWSGAIIQAPFGSTFEFASGEWVIPAVSPSMSSGECDIALWVGIDGAFKPSADVFQAGLGATVENGQPATYFAWWEWYPEPEIQIVNFAVAPGHVMICQLTVTSNKSGNIFLRNLTTGQAAAFQITDPNAAALLGNSAEWIVERPTVNGVFSILPDYGQVDFSSVAASTHVGITGTTNAVILRETSPDSPTLASLNGVLYLSWRGVDNNLLSIACSTDNGQTFGQKFISTETSSDSPVLCAHNGNLMIAWKGVDNTQLSVATVALAGNAPTGIVNKVILNETSPDRPSLASLAGRLYLSWRGVDNNQLSVACSTNNGRTFGHKFISTETSSDSPVLCAHNGNLMIAWKGVDNTQLSVATVALAGDTVIEIVSKTILEETSLDSPTLASLGGRLFLSWRGLVNNQLSVSFSSDQGHTFGDKFLSTETSSDSPVLCANNGSLIIAWKGVDNTSLTVATANEAEDALQPIDLRSAFTTTIQEHGTVVSIAAINSPADLSCTYTGSHLPSIVGPVILNETSPDSPTLASLNGRLYLSWRGVDNNQLSVACSTDNGRTFGHKFISTETSSDSPVLCAHNGNLMIAWKGVDNTQLSVAAVALAGDTVTGIVNKVILNETSPDSPTLASLNGRLYLSWRGVDNNLLSVACSTDNGRTFGHKFVSIETSSDSPALCASSSLLIAWKGVDNTQLSVATVALAGDTVTGIFNKVILGETSLDRPTLASLTDQLILSWRGLVNNQLSVSVSNDQGHSFGDKLISTEASSDSPVLCANNGSLVIAWKGVDNTSLTVAGVAL